MNNQQWVEQGLKVVADTYARYPIALTRGEGCRVWDADDNEYLDFVAGIAVNNLGHCPPRVVEAIREQAGQMLHCSNLYHIPAQIELAQWLTDRSFADKAFFCNSGAEANEAAVKLARKYSKENGGSGKCQIITALASFHGRTLGTIAATGQEKVRVGFAPQMPGFGYVPYGDIDALHQAIDPSTCAVMLEPVQGEGGVVVPPAGYLQAVRELCDHNGLLLIFDEVQVGCGRTGSLFAYEQEGVTPDIMTLAKALAGGPPIGAMLAREEIAASFGPGSHGSTFGGNPLMTAAALAACKALTDDGILEQSREAGKYFRQQLEELADRHLCVKEVRGRGLILGLHLTCEGGDLVRQAMDQGILINCAAGTVLRFLPPLTVSRNEIDRVVDVLDGLLAKIS